MRYLLIEDNTQLAEAITERLLVAGHVVDHAQNLAVARAFTQLTDYDLILLDIMLPDGDGRQFLQSHRAQQNNTPVVVLTARSDVSDRVSLLDLGADDYLTKPFDFSELEARCRAVLRRLSGGVSNGIQLGDLRFDALAGTITIGENTIALRNKELRLLEILLSSPNQIFSKSKLLDRLFAFDEEVSGNVIEVYVGRLRKHLQDSSVSIVTVRGIGYKISLP